MTGHPTYHANVIKFKMRDYIDRRVTPPKWVTSPTWGPHLHVNRPLYPRDGYAFEDYLNKRKRLLRHETS